MTTRSFVAVALAGLAVSAGVAWWGGLGGSDTSVLLAWGAGGAAALAGTAAALVLRSLRSPRAATQAMVAALAPVIAVAVGVSGAADTMFTSAHEPHGLLVMLVGAGTLGVVTALAVAHHRTTDHRVPLDAPDELVDLGAQLEAALARVDESGQQAAAAVEKSRREIVAWLSHDLRTSLAGIRAMADALEDGLVDDPATVARYHHTMRKEIDRLAGLVDDLFELSRIDTGAVALDLEQVPLDALVSDAVAGPADGCGGIPPPELPRVFDLAYQGHGEISVADDGGGCRFTTRLPLVANGQSPHSQPTSTS